MFHCLSSSLNIAFQLFPLFDQVQTLSSKTLRYKQMFNRLATLSHKPCESEKRQPSQAVFSECHVIISAGIPSVLWAHLLDISSNIVCPFSHSTFCATNTMLDKNVQSFSRGFIDVIPCEQSLF